MYLREDEQKQLGKLEKDTGRVGRWCVDLNNNQVLWCDEVYRIHGISRDEYNPAPESLADIYNSDDRQKLLRCLDRALISGEIFSCPVRVASTDGREKAVLIEGVKGGVDGRLVGIVREVPQINDFVRKSEQAQKDAEQFVHIIAHDLKAPLRAIRNSACWLEEDMGGNLRIELKQHIDRISHQSRQMSQMISDLLAYASIGTSQEEAEPIHCRSLIEEIAESMDRENIRLELTGEAPCFSSFKKPFSLIWQKLIDNAVKHNDKRSIEICVHCNNVDGGYQFRISDNGPGIPPEYCDTLFLPFRKLKECQGTGMGLTIAKKIVQHYGGKLDLTEPKEGDLSGAVFLLYWPYGL